MASPDWIDSLSTAWAREYPDLDVAALPPLVRLARLSVLIETFQAAVLEPFELGASDYSVLATLRRAGRPYHASPSDLYSRLQRSSGGMTKILKRLEQRGLVRRQPDPDDGRGSLVGLTRSGLAVQERIFNAFLAASNNLLADAGKRRLSDVDRSLRLLVDSFEGYLAVAETGVMGR